MDLAHLQCGPMDHSRWLTAANRTLKLWTCNHSLEGEDVTNLEMVVEWLVGCYYPMWFAIKINHHWLYGPYHVLHQLSLFRQQREVVQNFTVNTIKEEAGMLTLKWCCKLCYTVRKRQIGDLQ